MNKNIILSLLMVALFFVGCGDDALFKEENAQSLKQYIYLVPDRFSGEPYNSSYLPSRTSYINANQDIKLWAVISKNSSYMDSDEAKDNVKNFLWTIGEETFNVPVIRYTFSDPGKYTATLRTVDFYDDTLRDTIDIYVNTPISIDLIHPENGYNLVEADKNTNIELRWKISGIDEWEFPNCYVYISSDKKNVWKNPAGSVDCEAGVSLMGKISEDTTLYWGLKVINHTHDYFEERDSSEIFSFSTKFSKSDSALLDIPLSLEKCKFNFDARTQITLTSANGDTLKTLINTKKQTTISTKVFPQTKLKIYVEELDLTEYGSKEFQIDVPEAAHYISDSILLVDSIPPQYAPLKRGFDKREDISFIVTDYGSGINANRIKAWTDFDSIPVFTSDNLFKIEQFCSTSCNLYVSLEDYASNKAPNVYWEIQSLPDSSYISGPFLMDDF